MSQAAVEAKDNLWRNLNATWAIVASSWRKGLLTEEAYDAYRRTIKRLSLNNHYKVDHPDLLAVRL